MSNITPDNTSNSQKTTGDLVGKQSTLYPIVDINGYRFSADELRLIEIETSGFLPTCSIILEITNSGTIPFFPKYFPKDNDLVSVFFRSYNDKLKPIRNDYLIQEVETTPTVSGDRIKIFISGILFVKNLYSDVCTSVKDVTSIEALTVLSESLDLGFVTNESPDVMNDKMTWISPQTTFYEFIKHISSHAYKDEFSFFDCWIDIYYNLNFVNLHKLYDFKETDYVKNIQTEYRLNTYSDDIPKISKGSETELKFRMTTVLSNDTFFRDTEGYFNEFALENKSSTLNIINGQGRNLIFYDKNLESKINILIESSKTEGLDPKTHKYTELNNENYSNSTKTKWAGFQYSKPNLNVHNYYKISEIQNIQNISNVSKLNLKLGLNNMNFSIYKGIKVPVIIKYQAGSPEAMARIKTNTNFLNDMENSNVPKYWDEFFSGSYIVDSIKYKFVNTMTNIRPGQGTTEFGTYSQEVRLSRREWGKYSIDLSKKEDLDKFYPEDERNRNIKSMIYKTPKEKNSR